MAKILIIEDNPTNLDLMSYLLAAYGHTVIAARDGEQGLEAARRESPDFIVCDIQLPKIDGHQVVQRLKNHPALRKIPLVAVTAFAMVGDREKLLEEGFDGYIAKPIDPQTFVGEIERLLPRRCRPQGNEAAGKPGNQRVILVVDNSPVNISLARSTLEPFGYELVAAHNVAEGIMLARQLRPDLILSDLHMPGQDGYDFLNAVKANTQLANIPFAFISSTVWREADQTKALDLGACKFIVRPIDPQALLAEIEACLKTKSRDKE